MKPTPKGHTFKNSIGDPRFCDECGYPVVDHSMKWIGISNAEMLSLVPVYGEAFVWKHVELPPTITGEFRLKMDKSGRHIAKEFWPDRTARI